MRKTLLTKLVLLLVMLVGAGSAWADTVTFDATTDVKANASSYQTTEVSYTATDGSVWKANGYGATANTSLVIGKGGANYLETPNVNGTITSVAVTWSGNTSYYLALQTTEGTELEAKSNSSSFTTETFTVSGTYSQLRLVGRRQSGTSNAAATITKVVVTYISGSLSANNLALTGAPVSLKFDLYNNNSAQTVSYTTSGTGAITVSGGDGYVTTVVDQTAKTITVTPVAKTPSAQIITVKQAADDTYNAGSVTFAVSVDDSTPFTGGNVTFVAGTDKGTYTASGNKDELIKDVVTISCTNAAFASDQYRMYSSSTTTISSSGGYKIKSIQFICESSYPASRFSAQEGWTTKDADGTWSGEATSVTFTADGGQVRATKIVVTVASSTTPNISVNKKSVEIDANGGDGTIDVTYNNISTVVAEVKFYEADGTTEATYSWITADINSENNVYYIINENTDATSRTAYIKVLAMDDESNILSSELITFTQAMPNYATLPFAFDGGKSAIDNTAGLTPSGLGSDYSSSPKLKFDHTGDYLILKINENPGILTFDIKGNSFSGGTFTVQTSEDGTTYTGLKNYTTLDNNNTKNEILALPLTARYIKWIYTNKSSGNVALGNISLAKPVAVTSFGWATYITPCDMQFEAGNAFIVTDASVAGGLTLSEVTKVPADSPILLKGEGEKAMTALSVAPSALDDMSSNKLSVCDDNIESGKYPYVLAKEGTGAAFKRWTGNYSVLDGRVVLLLDEAVSAARSFFMLDDETTGIASVKVTQSTEQVYDLQGRRVAQPTKGLYIVNGKKMILK